MKKFLLLAIIALLPALLLFGAVQVMAGYSLATDVLSDDAQTLETNTPMAPPDLAPSVKLVTPTALLAGETLSYTIVLSNSGDTTATVLLSDVLPVSTTYLFGSLSATTGTAEYSATVRTVFWMGVVSPTAPVSISFGAMVSPSVPGGTIITNTAEFSHDGIDYERSAVSTVIPSPADLALSQKSVTPTAVLAGDALHYTVLMRNSGETTANVLLTDTLPADTTYVAGSLAASSGSAYYWPPNQTVYWLGDVTLETPVSLTFSVDTDPGLISGTLVTNTAKYSYNHTLFETSATARLIEQLPMDLSTSRKTVDPTVVLPGGVLSYTIALQNTGYNTGTVYLSDAIPDLATYVEDSLSASSGKATYNADQETIFWAGDIVSGGFVTISFRVTVSEELSLGDQIINTARFTDGWRDYERSATAGVAELSYLPLLMNELDVEP